MTSHHMPVLIGMGGLKTSGKDTAADFLVEHRGFAKVGMSEHLHLCLMVLNPWISVTQEEAQALNIPPGDRHVEPLGGFYRYATLFEWLGYDAMKRIDEVREIQQRIGTEVGRNLIDDDVWVNGTGLRIDALRRKGIPVVVTGIRYANELRMIRRMGGHTIWVDRPSVRAALGRRPTLDTHSSETSLDHNSFDRVLTNDGSRDELCERIIVMVEEIEDGIVL